MCCQPSTASTRSGRLRPEWGGSWHVSEPSGPGWPRGGHSIVACFDVPPLLCCSVGRLIPLQQGYPHSQLGDRSSRFEQLLPALVDQIYRAVLCRPADTDGLSHYVDLITSGKIDLARFVNIAYESAEYLTLIGPAIEEVRTAYRRLFEREPTQAEIYDHVQTFRGTCSTDDEAISLLRTDGEARARFAIRPLKIEMDVTN